MISNGFIVLKSETGGGFDTDLNPIASTVVESEKIDCNVSQAKREYKVLVNGKYLQAKYTVTVDTHKADVDISTIKNVVLFDKNNVDLGKFLVLSQEAYGLLNSYKLTISEIT